MKIITKAVFSKYRKLYNVNVKLDNITIFIGQNNSGNSTLLEGISNVTSTNIALSNSKYFSKVHDEDASIRVFFEINEKDLQRILIALGIESNNNDKLFIQRMYLSSLC